MAAYVQQRKTKADLIRGEEGADFLRSLSLTYLNCKVFVSSNIGHQTSDIRYQTSVMGHWTWDVGPWTSDIRHQTS